MIERVLVPARAVGGAAATIGALGLYEVRERFVPPGERNEALARWRARWVRSMVGILGLDLDVQPALPAPAKKARLVVANHRSSLDIFVMLRLFGGQILSRGDLSQWPLIGYGAKRIGTLFVDRGEGGSRAAALRAIRTKLEQGETVTVFAEGNTYVGDEVRPFHAGSFLAAKGLDVEIVPVGIAYHEHSRWKDEHDFPQHFSQIAAVPRHAASVVVGRGHEGIVDPRKLAPALRDEVQALADEARRRLR